MGGKFAIGCQVDGKLARLFGYNRIFSYTLEKESGASLRAVGAKVGEVQSQE